ncbi:DNA helicase [Chryseobacterium lacus]|uniref:DNA helicase n=1 Tax=Chryseobacterium lacus TaxID=2058346 RepID=A0A368MXP4_9FLAO|nr:DEAD/DEAH box helicase [Chryseobacterium lacus]RCU42786.1 DNA helicase [Chryseobacterium lacus]RST27351.1 DNA helicase [Chryseobacterium lacus]
MVNTKKIVEGVPLDEANVEFNMALEIISHTNKLVFLTGKAGTGKTTFLKYLKQNTQKNTIILAPTGVAAVNAGGQTIHSFFQIKPSIYLPNDRRLQATAAIGDVDRSTIYDHFKYFKEKIEIIKNLELLIIDEISMVRCDLLDVVDKLLRTFRRRKFEPFGGVQVILIGDVFQLSPITKPDEWEILKTVYSSPFFFSSKILEINKPLYIELKKIYRQNDLSFIDLLNKVRKNQLSDSDFKLLNSKYNPLFIPENNSNYITLSTHNKFVQNTNDIKLSELETKQYNYEAVIERDFPEHLFPTEKELKLKEGAQIMFLKNDRGKKYYNGKIAVIQRINEEGILIKLSNEDEILIERNVWNNIKYKWNENEKKIEEEILGSFTQYPLRLAWAITVHKSQGLTFENVIADLSQSFAAGQVYVALSRCTSFEGLILKSKIEKKAIITNPLALDYSKNETPSEILQTELRNGKADYFYRLAKINFRNHDFEEGFDDLLQGIRLRNDIETDAFKENLIRIAKRISKQTIKTKINSNLNSTNNFQFELDLLIENNKQLNEEKIRQNDAIKLLYERTNEYKNENEVLKKFKQDLENKNKKISQKVKTTIRDKEDLQKEIDSLNILLNECNEEKIRLEETKWYQKIFKKSI